MTSKFKKKKPTTTREVLCGSWVVLWQWSGCCWGSLHQALEGGTSPAPVVEHPPLGTQVELLAFVWPGAWSVAAGIWEANQRMKGLISTFPSLSLWLSNKLTSKMEAKMYLPPA